MYRYLSALLLLGVLLVPGHADEAEDDVRRAQANRFQAMLDADIEALDALLADSLTYTHSTGRLETKVELIESLQSQTMRYLSIVPSDIRVRVFGDIAVITAVAAIKVQVAGQNRAATLRTTEVHRRGQGDWQLVAYQSTGMPEQ